MECTDTIWGTERPLLEETKTTDKEDIFIIIIIIIFNYIQLHLSLFFFQMFDTKTQNLSVQIPRYIDSLEQISSGVWSTEKYLTILSLQLQETETNRMIVDFFIWFEICASLMIKFWFAEKYWN